MLLNFFHFFNNKQKMYSRACVCLGNDVSESFPVNVGLRLRCVMSTWLFNVYRKQSINKTSIITVELFVTMARLAQGQTLVIRVKISACNGYKIVSASVKNVPACINKLHPSE